MYILTLILGVSLLIIFSLEITDEVFKVFGFILTGILFFILICVSSFLLKLSIVCLILISLNSDKFRLKNAN